MNPIFKELIKNGLKVGKNTYLDWNCTIDQSHCWLIEIGDNVTVAPHAIILAHDASTKRELGVTRVAKTIIENGVFIGAGSIILPGVTVGKNSIVAAGAVITKNIPGGKIFAGNPAKEIGTTQGYIEKQRESLRTSKVIPYDPSGRVSKLKSILYKKTCLKDNKGFQE